MMQLLRADSVSFRYDTQPDMLFEDVSVAVYEHDRIGFVGRNGCGKSTLINVLRKEIDPVEGSVYHAKDLSIGYLPQELNLPKDETGMLFLWHTNLILGQLKQKLDHLEELTSPQVSTLLADFERNRGYEFEIKIEKLTTRFGFDQKMLDRTISSYSGGEQTCLALCRVLLGEPDVLLLDEPTNHLDIGALQWLEKFLNEIRIPYLMISHDRYILDTCVDKIIELTKHGIQHYSGNYSFYKEEKEQKLYHKIHVYEEQKKKIKKLKVAAQKRTQWAHNHQPETGSEGYAPVYECISNLAKNAMVQAKNLQRRVERQIKEAESEKPFIEKKRSFRFEAEPIKSRKVLEIENLSKSFREKNVFKNLNVHVTNGECVAIRGRNGSGKSTLLKIITGHLDEYEGTYLWSPQAKIGYYSQDYENVDFNHTVLDEITAGDMREETFARTVLGCLNISKKLINNQIGSLSVGERSKVALAKIIVSDVNVLVLDEPTNHLEIEAREALEDALQSYEGTIIFATHDRYLIERMSDRIIDMDRI